MQDFRKLRVWQAANQLTLALYATTNSFPPDERFGLTGQIRRAALSIQANIAEACGRSSPLDKARMLQLSVGSAMELANYLLVCRDLGLVPEDHFRTLEDQADHVRRMLIRLLTRVRATRPR